MTKVLTLKSGNGEITEVHALNAGEHFPYFGGNWRGLTVQLTASLIIHRTGPMGTHDTETDIHNQEFWQWMARLINDRPTQLVADAGRAE